MIYDRNAYFSQTMHVGLASAKVSALDGVVEKPVNGIAIVLIILGGVDAALSCN
jgi:hypothetical protein